MPFGPPILKQLITEIRYTPTILFHENRIAVCYRLTDTFHHWTLDIAKVEMYETPNKEESEKLFSFTNRGASILQKNVTDYESFRTLAERIFNNIIEGIRIPRIIRIGIRFFYITSSNLSFEILKDILCGRIYTQDAINTLSPNPTDLAFVVNFTQYNTNFHLVYGPVARNELRERFSEPTGEFFEVGLMIDLDCSINDVSLDRIHPFLRESYRNSQTMLERVLRFSEG